MLVTTKSEAVYLNVSNRRLPIYNVKTEEKKVALTFDAAWGADKTSKIVDIIKQNEVDATFFLVGFWSEKYADKIREIDSAGITIGTHSNTHPKMSTLSADKIKSELQISSKLIEDVTGKKVKYFRPPYGDYNDTLINVAESLELKTIQWDVDTLDWKGINANEILSRVKNSVKNGSIILMHNNSDHIVEALPLIISYLKSEGYKMVSIDELVYSDNFTINNNGTQIKIN